MTVQDQTLAAKAYRVIILKHQGSKKCKMCDERNETVMHIFSECSKLAQTEYRKRHAKVTTIVHWQLCCKYGFEPAKHCYEHRAQVMVMETQDTKILWDFSIRTVRVIDARHPDIVLINKNQETLIIDLPIPGDFRVSDKEAEKISIYQDLALKISGMWNTKTSNSYQ